MICEVCTNDKPLTYSNRPKYGVPAHRSICADCIKADFGEVVGWVTNPGDPSTYRPVEEDTSAELLTESTFTVRSEWCPRPEWWHSPDVQGTEYEVSELIGALVRATQPEYVLETGTYHGQTTRYIGEALFQNGHGHATSLERDKDRAHLAARRVRSLPVEVLHCRSEQFMPIEPIQLLFLDSEMPERPGEVERFWPYLTPGALIIVHDTAPHHVSAAFVAAMAGGRPSLNLRTPRGLLIFQKED